MPASLPVVTIGGELMVGRIGYGAMKLTGPQVWGDYPDRDAGIALLREVIERGVTFIDTADVYGPHFNELLIRDALYPYPEDLVIATKGGFVRGGFDYSTLDAVGNAQFCTTCTAAMPKMRRSRIRSLCSPTYVNRESSSTSDCRT